MIVKMKHLDLVCVAADREATLAKLRDLGAVHLDLASAQGQAVAAAKDDAADAEQAVRIVLKAKKDFGGDPCAISPSFQSFNASVPEILALQDKADALKRDEERIEREITKYEPYGDFDPALAQKLLDMGIDRIYTDAPQTLKDIKAARSAKTH